MRGGPFSIGRTGIAARRAAAARSTPARKTWTVRPWLGSAGGGDCCCAHQMTPMVANAAAHMPPITITRVRFVTGGRYPAPRSGSSRARRPGRALAAGGEHFGAAPELRAEGGRNDTRERVERGGVLEGVRVGGVAGERGEEIAAPAARIGGGGARGGRKHGLEGEREGGADDGADGGGERVGGL